jgi:hypothetical protein
MEDAMLRYFAVAALTVMFSDPLPVQAAQIGLSRDGVSLQNGISRSGITRNARAAADAIGAANLVTVQLPR